MSLLCKCFEYKRGNRNKQTRNSLSATWQYFPVHNPGCLLNLCECAELFLFCFFLYTFFFVLDQWQRWQGSQGIKRSQAKQTPTYGCHNRCCLERGRSAAEPPGRWSLGAELEVGWGRPRRMDSAWTLEKGIGDVRMWMGSPLLLGI